MNNYQHNSHENEKKKVLHVVDKTALVEDIGTLIYYLIEGINDSKDFSANVLLTTYDHKNHRPGKAIFYEGQSQEGKEFSHSELEQILADYDIVHVHGLPHYGIIENLQKIKANPERKTKIVNTVHSSVKQEFLAQYEYAKNSDDEEAKKDFEALDFYMKNNILNNPSRFADTYWGSAIYRQELIMTLADSVQHMNEAYKNDIIKEYQAEENAWKHKVIYNGVKIIDNVVDRPRRKRILFIGRFIKDKGFYEFEAALPKIFEKHPDAEIRFVGEDPKGITVEEHKKRVEKIMRDYFKDKPGHDMDKYLSQIEFVGWVKDEEKINEHYRWTNYVKHYRWTDYVILPGKPENYLLTPSEALMHKRIPIMTKTKALDELYISKGLGLGIDLDKIHSEGIAETVNQILDKHDSKEHDEIANKGRDFVLENYSFEKMIQNQLDSYRELIYGKKKDNKNESSKHNNTN
ncbi:MAG: glycosyltransferase family 4 protein [Candidatus Woesearchaeota archaeon]